MTSKQLSNGVLRAVAILVGVFALLYFFYKIQSVLVYIAIAIVVTLIARPIIRFLKIKLKFRDSIAVITTMFLFSSILFGLIRMIIPLIQQQSENLSLLNSNAFKTNIETSITHLNTYFQERNINIFEQLKSLDLASQLNKLPNMFNSVIGAFGTITIGLLSVLFISFFFMKDNALLNKVLLVIVPEGSESRFEKSFVKIKDLLSRYFIGLIFQISILFIIYTIILLIFGIKNAVVIAILCATLNLIPFVGPLIGGILMLFLTMTSNISLDFKTIILPTTIYVMLGYLVAQLIDNFLSQPIIFSKSVKSHPLEIFLSILIFGLLFGILGMVVAVPTYTAIKVILKEFFSENKIVKSLTKNL
ncbi:MAG: AI-2E family transporter [Flavobacteriaceae bacterium]|nr:AI-2E family transporter [Flavobacteriaceae bacterium]